MNQSRFLFSAMFVLVLLAGVSVTAYGQQLEPSYDVSLQLMIGSNDAAGRSEIPANLATISRQLKTTFAYSNYRLAATIIGRISNTGGFEYKSISNIFSQESDTRSQTFLEWSVGNFRNMPTTKGQQGFQSQSLRFGARVPVVTQTFKDNSGKMNPVINYESIGLSLSKVGLLENVSTLIGTLNLPGAEGTIFLVMTVRSADL